MNISFHIVSYIIEESYSRIFYSKNFPFYFTYFSNYECLTKIDPFFIHISHLIKNYFSLHGLRILTNYIKVNII